MKKILTVITMFLVMLSLGTTAAFAYSEEAETEITVDTEAEIGDADINEPVTEPENSIDGEDTEEEETTEDISWPDEIYELALTNADKIFAALACIASVIVGFAYKKGLLPLVKNSLNALGNGISNLREHTERAEEIAIEALSEATDKLSRAEEHFNSVSEKLSVLESELDKAHEGSMKDNELRIILTSQIDLLYEIFMSSSLPTYQKDSVGEKVAEMKRALSAESENE